jgi:hypothetical protein
VRGSIALLTSGCRESCVCVYAVDVLAPRPTISLVHHSNESFFVECEVSAATRELVTLSADGDDKTSARLSVYPFSVRGTDVDEAAGEAIAESSTVTIPLRLDPVRLFKHS